MKEEQPSATMRYQNTTHLGPKTTRGFYTKDNWDRRDPIINELFIRL
jgi:predicted carbohydrate-binding protein with CBM5 and CBM33 domain